MPLLLKRRPWVPPISQRLDPGPCPWHQQMAGLIHGCAQSQHPSGLISAVQVLAGPSLPNFGKSQSGHGPFPSPMYPHR